MTEAAKSLAKAIEKIVDDHASRLTSYEVITAIESVLQKANEDAGE